MKLLRFLLIPAAVLSLAACSFISSFSEDSEDDIKLTFDKNKTSILTGEMDVINLSASEKQNSASIRWEYDSDILFAKTDNYSAVITGLKAGTATLTARCGSNSASCIITVSAENYSVAVTNPYVYASQDYVDVLPNSTVKISASLFGGSAADIDGFTWSIDKPSVASLSCEGNYCWITGLCDGTAKVTLKHNKAAYGYSILVNCASDGTVASYITTPQNIITLNLSEKDYAEFSVDLVNPPVTDFMGAFTYCVVDELGNAMADSPAVIESASGLTVSLRARKEGSCYVRCLHPNAAYSLDVLVRVIANAETGFIEPSESILVVTGDSSKKLELSLNGYSGAEDASLYQWSFSEGYENYIDCEILNGDGQNTGNAAYIKGKKTGSVRITLSYPGLDSRCVVVLIRDIKATAADATTYITTSQNYIRLGKDEGEKEISVTLRNCDNNDINNLRWSIKNVASDGSMSDVIRWKDGKGTVKSTYESPSSRSAVSLSYSENASALIEPVNVGIAYIEVSHPKAVYKTLITVVVSEKGGSSEEDPYITFSGNPVISMKNGTDTTAEVSLGAGSESDIKWSIDEGSVSISPNGKVCAVTAPDEGSGGSRSRITASIGKSSVRFTIVCYDSEEEREAFEPPIFYGLDTIKTIYKEDTCCFYLNAPETYTTTVYTEQCNPETNETEMVESEKTIPGVDRSKISWNVISGDENVSITPSAGRDSCEVLALKNGKSQIRASYPGCDDVFFTVTIIEKDVVNPSEECYLTTGTNVLYFSSLGEKADISVEPVNLAEYSWSQIKWDCSSTLFEITASGNKAAVTCLAEEAEATLRITHPLSANELVVNLRSGKRYVYVNEDTPFISVDREVLELYEGQGEVSLYATLNHTAENEPSGVIKGFSFECTDESIASVSFASYSNSCFVKPIRNGTCKVIITHPDSAFEKEVVVVVKHAADASSVPYISTKNNVITMIQGDYTTATTSLMNSSSLDSRAWHWSSSDDRIASVIANNGTSAMISANKPGTVQVKITHDDAPYPLSIIVVVLDASVVTSRPYIASSTNIINVSKGSSETITAEMIGGNSSADSNFFKFYSSDSSVAIVTSASGSARISGMNAGMTYVTISNARYPDSYSKTVLIVVEDTNEEGVYISLSSSIVKLKPDEKGSSTVTATLVGGAETDAQDFVWWADDYSLIGITSVADTCAIMTVGKTGTTKLHVKHSKAAKTADILVLVSKYDTFAFSQASAAISTEKLYFYPLQVPALESGCSVKYSSSNPDVCLVEGSNSVAWVCGLSNGTASLTASLISDSDKTVIATAEMLVTVEVPEKPLPVISVGNSILTVQAGESQTFAAVISGDGVEDAERYNLKWSLKKAENEDGISFLNESAEKTAFGSDCYMTFNAAGEYVITVTHEKSGAETDLYIIVEDKGEILVELSSALETVYKDDGSFTLTANLTNGTDEDYKNLSWSAVKVNGTNIVAVSKQKGQSCTVTPKNVGQTTVIARLPTGQYAKCIVIVKAAAEITVDVGTVHVVPGYTEVINYTTNPGDATVNWFTEMATSGSDFASGSVNYFSIENDTVKKQLRVTGLRDCPGQAAGTITAAIMGAGSANMPKIKVYCEYKIELDVLSMGGDVLTYLPNERPDTKNTKSFLIRCWPVDLDVDIAFDDKNLFCDSRKHDVLGWEEATNKLVQIGNVSKETKTENGVERVYRTVTLIPHWEGTGKFSVSARLPSDSSGQYSVKKQFTYAAWYKNGYDIVITDSKTQAGAYTNFNSSSGTIELSDGEDFVFSLKIANENARGNITGLKWSTESKEPGYGGTTDVNEDKKRYQRAEDLFGENVGGGKDYWKISSENRKPANGKYLLSLKQIESEGGQAYWRFRHNWDYYQDVGLEETNARGEKTFSDMTNSEEWNAWYGGQYRGNVGGSAFSGYDLAKKGKQFDKDFWQQLKDMHVEQFMVIKEPVSKHSKSSFIAHHVGKLGSGVNSATAKLTEKTQVGQTFSGSSWYEGTFTVRYANPYNSAPTTPTTPPSGSFSDYLKTSGGVFVCDWDTDHGWSNEYTNYHKAYEYFLYENGYELYHRTSWNDVTRVSNYVWTGTSGTWSSTNTTPVIRPVMEKYQTGSNTYGTRQKRVQVGEKTVDGPSGKVKVPEYDYYYEISSPGKSNYWERPKAIEMFDSIIYNTNAVEYRACVPYVISYDYVQGNKFFNPRPQGHSIPNYDGRYEGCWNENAESRNKGSSSFKDRKLSDCLVIFAVNTDHGDDAIGEGPWGVYTSQAAFLDNVKYEPVLIPTIKKNFDKAKFTNGQTEITGQIVIEYKNWEDKPGEYPKSIPVKIVRRECEAYTKDAWEKDPSNPDVSYMKGHTLFN